MKQTLPVILSPVLKERLSFVVSEYKLAITENIWSKREEVTGGRTRLHNEWLHYLRPSSDPKVMKPVRVRSA